MEQRRLLLALVLSASVVLLYDWLVLSRYRQASPPTSAPMASTATTLPAESATAPDTAVTQHEDEQAKPPAATDVVVETDDVVAHITTAGARLTKLELKQFRRSVDRDSGSLALVDGGSVLPGAVQFGPTGSDSGVMYRAETTALTVRGAETGEVRFVADRPGGGRLEKRYGFTGTGYLIHIVSAASGDKVPGSVGLVVGSMPHDGTVPNAQESAVALVVHDLKKKTFDALLQKPESLPGASWAGFADSYFMVAAMPAEGTGEAFLGAADGVPFIRVDAPVREGAGTFALYAGPKASDALGEADHDLDRALDFGMFWFIAIPLLRALRLLDRLLGNYGLAIIVLTTLIKVATIPLTRVTFRNMREMQKIQPQMQKLRERYKDDQTALQKELMELYRRHRVNPFSGCLPMLLQLPIFVGLYNALMHAIELRHSPFFLWINDLSAPDRLVIQPFGHTIGIPVLTLLMGGSMLLQQMLTPAQGDPTQQRMMMFMPLVFTFMFINLPAGLVLYWLVNNIITIAQQYAMMRSG